MEVSLINLKAGQEGKIIRMVGGKGAIRNLESRGIRIGKFVKIVARQPAKGPVVIEIDGRETALGRGMVQKISVEVEK